MKTLSLVNPFSFAEKTHPRTRASKRRRREFLRFESLETRRVMAGTISGRVWIDTNYNGQQDAAETQNAAVTVQLVSSGNVISQSATVNGTYTLSNVPTTQLFEVRFTLPAGYTLGPTAVGADATNNDFSVDQTAGSTVAYRSFVQAIDGQTIKLDAGIVQGANLTAFAWKRCKRERNSGCRCARGYGSVRRDSNANRIEWFHLRQQGVTHRHQWPCNLHEHSSRQLHLKLCPPNV